MVKKIAQENLGLSAKQIQQSIRDWLDARQKMMVAFNQLCLLKPFVELSGEQAQQSVEHFCTEVIDYLSFGQFKVFENITKFMPSEGKSARNAKILLSKIFSSTIQSIEFHDKYIQSFDLNTLEKDLSKLGIQLAHRLDWEDQLLDLAYEHIYAVRPPKLQKKS